MITPGEPFGGHVFLFPVGKPLGVTVWALFVYLSLELTHPY